MKKILYIVSTLKRTGPTNQLSYIIKYLDQTKFEAMILTLSPEPIEDSMKSYFTDALRVRIETLGLSRIKGLFFAQKYIRLFIKENGIDVVHSQGIRADGLMSAIDIPRVATLRNYPYYDYPMKFGKLKGALMARAHLKAIFKNPKNNIACAKTIANEFKQNNLKLQYIQNGVDTEKFFPLAKEQKRDLRERLGLEKDANIFITVGSLISRKDTSTVIEGFKKYNHSDFILLIAGDGTEKENLQENASSNVKFLGNISNVVDYLQISDCFISASLAEGLPNTVLEAMACGLSTVLSGIPSHKELYENENRCFFDIKDSKKLETLLEIVNKNHIKEKELSLKVINNKFNAKTMSNKYQKLYMEKINGK